MNHSADHKNLRQQIERHKRLFNSIAPIYNFFFHKQVNNYLTVLAKLKETLNLFRVTNFLDLGCGTGALLYSLAELGYQGTGVDISPRMLKKARQSTAKHLLEFIQADITQALPFSDSSFDVVISSYVLHGLSYELRQNIYKEARRIGRKSVLFYDYNSSRRLITDIVEWVEGGDYFNFIKNAEEELAEVFPNVIKHSITPYAAIYECKW